MTKLTIGYTERNHIMQNTSTQLEGLWIDINILKDSKLTLQEKFTLAIIKALDKSNGCFASNKYFAEILQVTPKRASDIIQSLITKNYITSTIEDNYKRTIRVVKNTLPQEENIEEEVPQEQQELSTTPTKKKPLIWKGFDLNKMAEDAIERLKRRFPELEAFLKGEPIDQDQPTRFRTNEELASTYREVPTEWCGVSQLQFT